MRRHPPPSILLGILTVVLHTRARAEPLRLEERLAPACAAAAGKLRPRLEHALGDSLPQELSASVAIEALGTGYRVRIGLRDAVETRGTTVIDAPTCDEAVDAAAIVLALALGKTTTPAAAPEPVSSTARPERASSSPSARSPTLTDTLAPPRERAPSGASEDATRFTLATGVDAGTLPDPTLTLTGGIGRSLSGVELAALARYGLPITEEVVQTDFSDARRQQFGGIELRACPGLGHNLRVSACVGTEVGAVVATRSLRSKDGIDIDTDHVSPRLSGTLAALVTHRGGRIQPALELAVATVAVGRDPGAHWLVMRAAAGAAIAF